jgi:ABC-2 type transport system permease protein
LYWLLLPWRLVVAPIVATNAAEFARALAPALLVYALHYVWAFRVEVSDHDTTVANAVKRAKLLAAMSKGRGAVSTLPPRSRRDPFALAERGSPVYAFLWKNLVTVHQHFNVRILLASAGVLIAWDLWMGSPARYEGLARLPTMAAFIVGSQALFLGSQYIRQDLRSDLDNVDLIKTWPLQGWQVVLGELLAPVWVLTGILWLCLLQLFLVAESPERAWLTPQLHLAGGLSLAIVVPFLCAVQLLVANSTAVMFPAWLKSSGAQGQGFELVGHGVLFLAGQWLAVLAVLLPAVLIGAVVYVPLSWFIDVLALIPTAVVVAVVLAGQLAWGINWLGERFDAHDVTA